MGRVLKNLTNKEQRTETRLKAYDLRLRGTSFPKIAQELGVSTSTAFNLCKEELEARVVPATEEFRKQLLDECDLVIQRLWELANTKRVRSEYGKVVIGEDGKPELDYEAQFKAYQQLLKYMDHRAKLTGAYKPATQEINVNHSSPVDDNILNLVKEMEEKNRAAQAQLSAD